MKITILFGTESGNAEMAAEDLSQSLSNEHEVSVQDLASFSLGELTDQELFIFICSTYGEGELPNTALPFFAALSDARPDLTGVEYSIFGLGDSFYTETYGQGSIKLDSKLMELGARRVGDFGRHDASTWEPVGEAVIAWYDAVLKHATAASKAA